VLDKLFIGMVALSGRGGTCPSRSVVTVGLRLA
jgi:hypothetical protein